MHADGNTQHRFACCLDAVADSAMACHAPEGLAALLLSPMLSLPAPVGVAAPAAAAAFTLLLLLLLIEPPLLLLSVLPPAMCAVWTPPASSASRVRCQRCCSAWRHSRPLVRAVR